jgi:hypothetical protein
MPVGAEDEGEEEEVDEGSMMRQLLTLFWLPVAISFRFLSFHSVLLLLVPDFVLLYYFSCCCFVFSSLDPQLIALRAEVTAAEGNYERKGKK